MLTEQRFWSKVKKTETCWEWTACVLQAGYGQTYINGKKEYAHRYAYELLVGPIPKGLVLDHLCWNRKCVNPSHLEVVTHKVNTSYARWDPEKKIGRPKPPTGHGSISVYSSQKCRCEPCRAAKSENNRIYKTKIKESKNLLTTSN